MRWLPLPWAQYKFNTCAERQHCFHVGPTLHPELEVLRCQHVVAPAILSVDCKIWAIKRQYLEAVAPALHWVNEKPTILILFWRRQGARFHDLKRRPGPACNTSGLERSQTLERITTHTWNPTWNCRGQGRSAATWFLLLRPSLRWSRTGPGANAARNDMASRLGLGGVALGFWKFILVWWRKLSKPSTLFLAAILATVFKIIRVWKALSRGGGWYKLHRGAQECIDNSSGCIWLNAPQLFAKLHMPLTGSARCPMQHIRLQCT